MIYLLVFIFLLFFSLRFDYRSKKAIKNQSSTTAMYISFIMLVLLAGLRYRVGVDTINYTDEYNDYPLSYFEDRYQIGWYVFILLFRSLGLSFYWVQISLALLTNFAVFSFVKKYSQYFFFSILLYYVVVFPVLNFEILRQGICVSLFLLSFKYLDNRNYIRYYLLIGLACLFHYSALILLLLPLFTWIPINKKTVSLSFVLVLSVLVLSAIMKEQIFELSMGMSFLEERAQYYFSEVDLNKSVSVVPYIVNLTLNVLIPFIIIWHSCYNTKVTPAFIIVCILSMIVYVVSIYMPVIYRFNSFFQVFNLIIIIDFFSSIRNKFEKRPFIIFFILVLLFIGVKARGFFVKDEGMPIYYHYYPYSSIFNEFKVPQREHWD